MVSLTFSKILNVLRANSKMILKSLAIGLIVGVVYSVIVFRPMYKSTARLLIKNVETANFVAELGGSSNISSVVRNGNPALTQIQIINSKGIAKKVWEQLSSKYNWKQKPQQGIKIMQHAISAKNPVGTDIIEITAKWKKREVAKDIAEAYKDAYISLNLGNAKQSITQSKQVIDIKLEEAQDNLINVRNKIKQFKEEYSTVDISAEAQRIVEQVAEMENRQSEIISNATSEGSRGNIIANKLGLDWVNAINSVALGHNATFNALQAKLGEAKEEQAVLSTKYTPLHPSMVELNAKITDLQKQLQQQIKITIGEKQPKTNLVISDPVRTGMIDALSASQANYRALMAQSRVLGSTIQNLKNRVATIPNKQLVLSNLTQEEANWANIVNALKSKQVEATIKEAEITSSISMVDAPVEALSAAFPNRIDMIVLITILGGLIGTFSSIAAYVIEGKYDKPEELEKEVDAPLLGVMPWLEKEMYDEIDSPLIINDSSSYLSIAYQKIITNIRLRGLQTGINSLVFTSTGFSKQRSSMLMNVALGLSKMGQSVIVVDADFRTPSVYKELTSSSVESCDLTRALASISNETKLNGEFNWEYLPNFFQKVTGVPTLHLLGNSSSTCDSYELINTKAFSQLVAKLKEKYDWVLIDSPPAMAVPDAVNIASVADAVLLTVDFDSSRENLSKLTKLFSNNNISIFGIIARELQTKEAASSNEYIKQIISKMMDNDTVSINT